MSILYYLLTVLIITAMFALAVYLRRAFLPTAPPQIDTVLWVICLIAVIVLTLQAFGISARSPRMPQLQ